ncbi:hypothetical protein [Gordonia hydrophobica]|uniref:Condensation domain-containing protein n=1 Tax=Gordonia hydrophobica TaxID=40516 RepID=A0ABZ2TY21_9ACTN|nr:hypothetical protein [Gordonia hydrophobica]MBM7366953.1 hypothetical protein [Gordonia hydrophobica]
MADAHHCSSTTTAVPVTAGAHLPASCTVTLSCEECSAPRHDVVIETDWTVTTPSTQEHSCRAAGGDAGRARRAYRALTRRPVPGLTVLSPLTDSDFDDRFAAVGGRSRNAVDILTTLLRRFDIPSPAPADCPIDDLPPMAGLTDDVVVPGILAALVRSADFGRLCARIVASPVPDHREGSAVPGSTRWSRDDDAHADGSEADRTVASEWAQPPQFGRVGDRIFLVSLIGGRRAIRVRRGNRVITVPIDEADVDSRTPVDVDDPLYRLSAAMVEAVDRSAAGTPLRRTEALPRQLHECGEYFEAMICLVYAYPGRRPPWSVRICLILVGLALRGVVPRHDARGVIDIVSRHLVVSAPELYGLPREFADRWTIATGPAPQHVDVDALAQRTDLWLRSILAEAAPIDGPEQFLHAVTVTRRPHDLVCTWGPESTAFQYSRVGHEAPIWEATAEPTARTRLIQAAYLLAFTDVTGVATILPPVSGDATKQAVRSAYVRSIFDVPALARLTSVPLPA